jgi:hypothetical protein
MKLKDLKNNFTTPEQSLKLLEIGFSASTADCLRESEKYNDGKVITYREAKEINEHEQFLNDVSYEHAAVIPTWSVGQLIALINNYSSTMPILCYQIAYNTRHKNSLIEIVFQFIQDNKDDIDFKNMK